MNTVDIILLICLVPAVVQGFIKGFISQVAALLGLILGVWASFHFSEAVSAWLLPYMGETSPQVVKILAFAVILIVVILLLYLAGKALKGVIKLVLLGWLDKLLGIVFSLAKAVLIIGLLIMAFEAVNSALSLVSQEVLNSSVLYPALKSVTDTVFPYLKQLTLNG
ncbi:MAG: CvpA family protein [Bacteroidales bacterium]|nr:CvpA family protein [Bacteroidales bacterium]